MKVLACTGRPDDIALVDLQLAIQLFVDAGNEMKIVINNIFIVLCDTLSTIERIRKRMTNNSYCVSICFIINKRTCQIQRYSVNNVNCDQPKLSPK